MIWILGFLISMNNAVARDIDLGELDVAGEVRRPMLELVESDQAVRKVLPELARRKAQEIQARLLRYTSPEEAQAIVHPKQRNPQEPRP
jgi:hypothetical protein